MTTNYDPRGNHEPDVLRRRLISQAHAFRLQVRVGPTSDLKSGTRTVGAPSSLSLSLTKCHVVRTQLPKKRVTSFENATCGCPGSLFSYDDSQSKKYPPPPLHSQVPTDTYFEFCCYTMHMLTASIINFFIIKRKIPYLI